MPRIGCWMMLVWPAATVVAAAPASRIHAAEGALAHAAPISGPAGEQEAAACPAPLRKLGVEGRTVGDAGDLRRVDLVGIRLCDPVAVRRQLQRDLPLQAAARPSAPLCGFLAALKERLTEGYRHSGFADAVVDVTFDPATEAVAATVHEGQHFVRGPVRVLGCPAAVSRRLAERITQPRVATAWVDADAADEDEEEAEGAIWKPGLPARNDDNQRTRLARDIRRLLTWEGYPAADFSVELDVDRHRKKIALVVRIEDLGPLATFGAIEIRGLTRHARAQVLDYLELAEGDPLTDRKLSDIHERLRQSCRFWGYDVRVYRPAGVGSRYGSAINVDAHVVLDLIEYELTPLLGEPLGVAEAALLRFANLVNKDPALALSGELLVESEEAAPIAGMGGVSPPTSSRGRQVQIAWDLRDDFAIQASGETDEISWNHALASSLDGVLAVDGVSGQKLTFPSRPPGSCYLGFRFAPDEQTDEGYISSFRLRVGLRHAPDQQTVAAETHVEPVAAVHLAHRPGNTAAVQGRNLVLCDEAIGRVVIELATGKIKRFEPNLDGSGGSLRISIQQGAVARLRRQIASRSADCQEMYDGADPAGSSVRFLVASALAQSTVSQRPELSLALHYADELARSGSVRSQLTAWGFLSRGFAGDIRRVAFQMPLRAKDGFELELAAMVLTHPEKAGLLFLANYGCLAADELFPRGSWPWTVMREASFRQAAQFQDAELLAGAPAELLRVSRDREFGPLAIEVARACAARDALGAELVVPVKKPAEEAPRGDIHKDIHPLVAGENGSARLVQHAVRAYLALDVEQQDALAQSLPAPLAAAVRRVVKEAAENQQHPIGAVVELALVEAWEEGLRDATLSALRDLTWGESRQARATDEAVRK